MAVVREKENDLAALDAKKPPPLAEEERQQLMRLGADLELAWAHPAATAAIRKRIVRAVLQEIVIRDEGDHIGLILHWQGGDHTLLGAKKYSRGKRRTITENPEQLIDHLARLMPDLAIAQLLNRIGKPPGSDAGWTQSKVSNVRHLT